MCKNPICYGASRSEILIDENTAVSVKSLKLALSFFFFLRNLATVANKTHLLYAQLLYKVLL